MVNVGVVCMGSVSDECYWYMIKCKYVFAELGFAMVQRKLKGTEAE
jgi:hypothetical protein